MKAILIFLFSACFVQLSYGATPLFSEAEVSDFQKKLVAKKFVDEKALNLIFDFYRKERESVGGLQSKSCIDNRKYRLRHHDKKKNFSKKKLKQGIKNESCLCVIDYTKSRYKERGHCIFLDKEKAPVVESFLVTHGSGSGDVDGVPQTFTNKITKTGTTLSGLFITGPDMFQFYSLGGTEYGKYNAPGLALYGVESSNWTASRVGKVSHGAPYVKPETKTKDIEVQHSKGCPAMSVKQATEMLPRCSGQAAWLHYTNAVKELGAETTTLACEKKTRLK